MGNNFENIYDKYSTIVYGIAVEISQTKKEAEEIVMNTFIKFHEQNLSEQVHPSPCITLIRLMMQTASELINPEKLKTILRLKQFEKTPLLHNLLYQQVDLDSHCQDNNVSRADVGKVIREEVNFLRNLNNQE